MVGTFLWETAFKIWRKLKKRFKSWLYLQIYIATDFQDIFTFPIQIKLEMFSNPRPRNDLVIIRIKRFQWNKLQNILFPGIVSPPLPHFGQINRICRNCALPACQLSQLHFPSIVSNCHIFPSTVFCHQKWTNQSNFVCCGCKNMQTGVFEFPIQFQFVATPSSTSCHSGISKDRSNPRRGCWWWRREKLSFKLKLWMGKA